VSSPVSAFGTPELRDLVRDMQDTMAALNGAGIARRRSACRCRW
jgi:peptide deformylase